MSRCTESETDPLTVFEGSVPESSSHVLSHLFLSPLLRTHTPVVIHPTCPCTSRPHLLDYYFNLSTQRRSTTFRGQTFRGIVVSKKKKISSHRSGLNVRGFPDHGPDLFIPLVFRRHYQGRSLVSRLVLSPRSVPPHRTTSAPSLQLTTYDKWTSVNNPPFTP